MNNTPDQTTKSLCYSLATRQMARYVSRVYERHFANTGISPGDFSILEFLSDSENMTMAELTAELFMERTSLIRTLRPLQAKGFVESIRDPREPRRHFLRLTKEGEAKRLEAHQNWKKAQADIEKSIGEDCAEALRSSISQALKVTTETEA
jgi:DNA-binding MarR family transcriptional regulator